MGLLMQVSEGQHPRVEGSLAVPSIGVSTQRVPVHILYQEIARDYYYTVNLLKNDGLEC